MESLAINLRGWDYPHIDHEIRANMTNWIESGADFSDHVEYWRLYQSGQFIHYFAMFEDYQELPWTSSRYEGGRPEKYLEIVNTTLRLTEIYEFAARLAQHDVLGPDVLVEVTLAGTEKRELVYWDLSRYLRRRYVCDLPDLSLQRRYTQAELIAGVEELSRSAAVHIFERFNWGDVPTDLIAADQRRLLSREG